MAHMAPVNRVMTLRGKGVKGLLKCPLSSRATLLVLDAEPWRNSWDIVGQSR